MSHRPVRLLSRLRQIQAWPCCGLQRLAQPWLRLPRRFRSACRDRIYPLRHVFWIFLSQTLAADKSCARAVRGWLAALAGAARFMPAPDTAAYCRARARLAVSDLRAVLRQLRGKLIRMETPHLHWRGRRVRVVDGSSLSMPDTAANQRRWPQPRGQRPGCGFPVMRLVVLFSLASGAALSWARGPLSLDERSLWRRLWRHLAAGDVVLADRGFCDFASWCLLTRRGVDCVMRLHARRDAGVRRLRRLGRRDWLVAWTKTKLPVRWLNRDQWSSLPGELHVRHVRLTVAVPGWRTSRITIATTLLDHRAFPASALAELYLRRWRAELYLRDIKTTLGMDVLRCKTPAMIQKELLMFMIGYNLIRALMFQAAAATGTSLDRLSFKGAVSAFEAFASQLTATAPNPGDRAILFARLLETIARDTLPHRPLRTEPRARKRRPKNYPLLTQHRHQYTEVPHRNRYTIA